MLSAASPGTFSPFIDCGALALSFDSARRSGRVGRGMDRRFLDRVADASQLEPDDDREDTSDDHRDGEEDGQGGEPDVRPGKIGRASCRERVYGLV